MLTGFTPGSRGSIKQTVRLHPDSSIRFCRSSPELSDQVLLLSNITKWKTTADSVQTLVTVSSSSLIRTNKDMAEGLVFTYYLYLNLWHLMVWLVLVCN